MSIVTSVHFKVVRCHQFKKRHHMRLLKVFADLKSFPWSGDVHNETPFMDEEGSGPQTQQLDRLWNAAYKWAQDRKALSWADSGFLESAEVGSHRLSGPSCPEGSQMSPQDERLLLNNETRDSWPPEEMNSIQGQRRGWIAQSFCVIKFY